MLRSGRAPALALVLLVATSAGAASFPPELRFRTLHARRASVHFHDPLEPAARRVAALADQILERHETRYGVRVGRVQIVVADTDDDPNGFATPFPYPLVQIRVAAPDGSDLFGNHDGWLRLVLTHELAHVVHLEQARGALGVARRILGRAPLLFPNTLTPTWMIEGLATFEETEGTAFGRGRNPDSRMVLRMAALEGRFPPIDRAVLGLDAWPGGQAAYLFGEAFLRQLSGAYGVTTLPRLARVHAGRAFPFLDDFTARKVTGAAFSRRWAEWAEAERGAFELEAESRRDEGLTRSQPVTDRGVRQTGPRFSPDGEMLAYTSGTLDRYREIRLVARDGSGDRRLALRNGGSGLAWTPDGKTLVYDEPDRYRLFRSVSDLRRLDVRSGRSRRLTRGLRARDPDVTPDGSTVVFVRRFPDRSDVFAIGLDGARLRRITQSPPDTEWSGPRVSPDGRRVVASRWSAGGFLDLALVDMETGAVVALTHDRAKDVEPAWLPDGTGVVYRSDRDGASNLYRLDLSGGAPVRLTNVLGGAFAPDVARDGRTIAFADYSARGFDVHLLRLEPSAEQEAPAFRDPYPQALPEPAPFAGAVDRYRPFPVALPRFWLPYLARRDRDWQIGAVTAGADPLLQHAYALEARYGTATRRGGLRAAYQYDRLRPTLLLTVEDTTAAGQPSALRTRELSFSASLPLHRTQRASHDVSLGWRRRRESLEGSAPRALDLGGVEAGYAFGSARRYPFSISPVDGARLRLAALRETPALGSDVSLTTLTADARAYFKLGPGALALRLAGGTTFGQPAFRRSFAVGGFPDGALRDVVRTNLSVLRGYPEAAFTGRSFWSANIEARLPLAHPQRGLRTLPLFLRHLHVAGFVDAGDAWSGALGDARVRSAIGIALGADSQLAHALPITFSVGVARGLRRGETQFYLRNGLSF